jgi:hypothetical protein
MAARDILTLDKSIAPRLIRCLYIIAMVLIAVLVILGIARGVRVMTLQPPPRPAAASAQTPAPGAATPQPPGPGAMMNQGMMNPGTMGPGQRQAMRQMMARRFAGRPRGPFAMAGLGPFPRQPVVSGLFIIFFTLLRGAVVLLVVRILAEMGLAVLAMPRRSEA